MSTQHEEPERAGATAAQQDQEGWPHCHALGGTCPVYLVGSYLGDTARLSVLRFILGAEEGARLTLQKNRVGFTVQVTGAVQRSEGETFGLAEARVLRETIEQLTKGSAAD